MKLTRKQQKKMKEIALKYQLRLVLLFGSHAKGRAHKKSDIDLAFLTKKPLSFKQEYHLNYEFTKLFQKELIDTVNLMKAPPLLLYAIFQNPKVVYKEDDDTFPSYRVYAFKKYIEAKPLYNLRNDMTRKQLSKVKI